MLSSMSVKRRSAKSGLIVALACLFLPLAPVTSYAADAEAGRKSFQKCASCHVVGSEANGFGPHLKGVFGRRAASVAGYNYSAALRDAGSVGLVWDEASLSAFLSSPKAAVPGNKMSFFGFWFQSDIDDMIAYLKANP